MRARLLALALLLLAPLAAAAQTPARLVADRVAINADRTLTAEGNVEVFFEDARLTATRITYDRASDRLSLDGPIQLTTGPDTVLLADTAALSSDLREGLLESARLVLDRQLQLAAAELSRIDGRYSRLSRTVASACRVCGTGPPLWQIRAREVIHDEAERMLYFDNARFELAGIPIAYIPRLRLPDPTRERATGFLVPSFRSTSRLGSGIRVPYFITLGRHADLTLTPYVATDRTRSLGLRYRQAFRRGKIEVEGALSNDDIRPGETRTYLFTEGEFDLPRDFTLSFDTESVSDDAYLLDYGISDRDRLDSEIALTRTRRDEFIRTELLYLESLRQSEDSRTLPSFVTEALYERRFHPGLIGGTVDLGFAAHAHGRRSSRRTDGPDPGAIPDGRDVARATARIGWRRGWTLPAGARLATAATLVADRYSVRQDATFPDSATRTTPSAEVTLRWPLVKAGAAATQVLEPVAQLAWSGESDAKIPNEDSTAVEFDEGNLFALSRFPGADRREHGLRANLGLGWTRYHRDGSTVGLILGRVIRAEDADQFTPGSGLAGTTSDWLLAARLAAPGPLSFTNRALFDDSLDFAGNELRLDLRTDRLDLASTLIWREASLAERRVADTAEWTFDAAYRLSRQWTGKTDWRYDFEAERAAEAGIGVEYRNECITVDVSLSRRFTSSTNLDPSTDFGVTVALAGFGAREGRGVRRRCTG